MQIQNNYVNYNNQNRARSNRTNAIGFGNKKLEVINAVSEQTKEAIQQLGQKMSNEGVKGFMTKTIDGTKLSVREIGNNLYNVIAKKGSKSTYVNINSETMSFSKVNPNKTEVDKYNSIGGIALANIEVRGYINKVLGNA